MLPRFLKRLFSLRLRLAGPQDELVHRSALRRLRTDSEAYHKLVARLDEARQDHYLPVGLEEFLPIDSENVEVPDYLPEDL